MAEVSLAVIGLAAQLFISVVQTYRFISDAQGLVKDAPELYWKLRLEEIRLLAWGRYWGLDQGKFDDFLQNAGLLDDVCGILTRMKEILQSTESMSKKYGIQRVEDPGVGQMTVVEEEEAPKKRHKLVSKFKWAFTDKTKFQTMITDLQDFNNGLHSLLRLGEYRAVGLVAQSESLRITESIATLSHLQKACIEAIDSQATATTITRSSSYYRDLLLATSSKQLLAAQSMDVVAPTGTSLPSRPDESLLKESSLVKDYTKNSPSSLRLLASYSHPENPPTQVLIEWKDIDKTNPHLRLISKRVNDLAELLDERYPKPADFRVLDCLGYFEDENNSRFGFLFSLPPQAQPIPPSSLHDLLARGAKTLPHLGERFEIARMIATSIIRLLDCGWVHAALRSENVVFFQNSGKGPQSLALSSPFILGFTYSRPQDPNESTLEYSQSNDTTHDLYRHPDVQRSHLTKPSQTRHIRFQQRHDLFSLGIVLLEIGLWEQIETLWKPKYTPDKFFDKLLSVYVPALGHRMGEVYRDVVWELLAGNGTGGQLGRGKKDPPCGDDEKGDDEVDESELGERGWADLIARLEACRA
ncbi:hypothetical protein V493_06320 [Pseudogymnoascus sp. VKM F-4281 (FW-2241)]|nr:hypothetical protein V493_06320 [Pseudogymnoascus sp. VKM F-4281 (FW-2241)]